MQVLSSLVARCLERDPRRRVTARDTLGHAFLAPPSPVDASAHDAAGRHALAQWYAQAQAGRDGSWDSAGASVHKALPQRGLEGLERGLEGLLSFFGRTSSA